MDDQNERLIQLLAVAVTALFVLFVIGGAFNRLTPNNEPEVMTCDSTQDVAGTVRR